VPFIASIASIVDDLTWVSSAVAVTAEQQVANTSKIGRKLVGAAKGTGMVCKKSRFVARRESDHEHCLTRLARSYFCAER